MHRSPALALALVWLATPSWPVAHFRPADWTPFETSRHGEIVVPAMVNGAGPFRFLIDSGSSHSAISEEVARAARAPAVARTVVTSPIGENLRLVVRIERLEIGPLSASGVLASVIRPNGIDTARGIQGLIGQDVLAAHRYTIDFRKHGIVWHADRPGPSSRQSTFELRLTDGRFPAALPKAIASSPAPTGGRPESGEHAPGSSKTASVERVSGASWPLVPMVAGLAGLMVLLAALLGFRVLNQAPGRHASQRSETARPEIARFAALQAQQMTIGRGFDGFLSFAPDGRSIAYSSDRTGALEIYVQGLGPGSAALALTGNGKHNVQPAWSPDGQFIAYHEMAGNGIWVVPSRGGTARKVSDLGARPAWSPDGQRIAFQSLPVIDLNPLRTPGAFSTIWIVEAAGTGLPEAVTTPGTPAGPHLAPAWSTDSRHVLFANPTSVATGRRTSLWIVDVEARQPREISSHETLSPDYAMAPDGQGVYFVARGTNTIWWLPLGENGESGADPQPTGIPTVGSMIANLAMSSDGRRMAWTVVDSSSHIWGLAVDANARPRSGDAARLTEGSGPHYGSPAPSTDGRLAFTGSRHGSGANLFLLEGAAPRPITTDSSSHHGPHWTPGDRDIAFVVDHGEGPGFWVVDPETGRERLLFPLSALHPPASPQPSPAAPAANIAIAHDFTRLAMSIVKDDTPNIWVAPLRDSRPDGPLVQRTFEQAGGSYPVWSPDGRSIAYQCSEGPDTHVCVTGADGAGRAQLTHEAGQSWIGGWTPDGDKILFAARRAGLWNVALVSRTSSEVRTLTHFSEPRIYVRSPRLDRFHSRVVFERSDTTGRIWAVELPVADGRR